MDSETEKILESLGRPGGWQMSTREYRTIAECVAGRSPAAFLVFGVGDDSALWIDVNADGDTVFIEDSPKWIDIVRGRMAERCADIRPCSYVSRAAQWTWWCLGRGGILDRRMPSGLASRSWDVILVDAPRGFRIWHPGRLQAIHWAFTLARTSANSRGVDLFVHDFNRFTERTIATALAGGEAPSRVVDRLAHYRIRPLPRRHG